MRSHETEPEDLPDREALLVARARRGDLEAFEQLYRRHLRRVYGLCRRLLDTDQDAEDMTQRVFVKAWRQLSSFRGASRWSTWLHRIAVNQVVSEKRRRWQRDVESLDTETPTGVATAASRETSTDPMAGTQDTETPRLARLDLEDAIRGLPAGARQILVLHDVEGFTHGEVAAMLGITAGTSKGQLSRARALMRRMLDAPR